MDQPTTRIPKRLHKYRSFNALTLSLLTNENVYYADPTTFNDPLDCDPSINVDTDRSTLEKLCFRMLTKRHGRDQALREMNNYIYMSSEYGDYKKDPEVASYYMRSLASRIRKLIMEEFSQQGVLSLASRWDCPLMWSHYADQHQGICIEYSLAEHACETIFPVRYARRRSIRISELASWKLEGSSESAESIRQTFFFSKAPQWRYEREWRVLANRTGEQPAPFRIASVYFGLRCSYAVTTNIVKLFENSGRSIKFYDIVAKDESFGLARRSVDVDEISAVGVTTSAILDFKDAFRDEPSATS
jgi:hypothetical protein